MITVSILMSFTTARIRQSQVATPKDALLALMTVVERVQKPVTGCLSVEPRMTYYLKYRCPKPGCAVDVIVFPDKAGYTVP